MSPQFNQQQKEAIRQALIAAGKDMFSRYGLKKTSIDDLTHAVGIAKGSFYGFFQSKEELYFDIFLLEEKKLREQLFLESTSEMNPDLFKTLLLTGFSMVWQNPFLKRLYTTDEYQFLMRKLPEHKLALHTGQDMDFLLPLVQKWQQEGKMIKRKPELIINAVRAIYTLGMHKNEIGEQYFQETVELLVELLVDGLFIWRNA
ncbi:TetR/AcrR family transcriptional regulator [candidate division KSB1 bacterium]|nr:TetR/AcrR family transcriptional regulator [candidate division KSB1 bacterium]